MYLRPSDTLLFIGDSITAAGRRDDPEDLGFGFVRIIRDRLRCRHPEAKLTILNRGVGGDTVRELAARWREDVLDLHPNVLHVSIGVNDVWSQVIDPESPHGVGIEEFDATYRELLTQVRESEHVRLMIAEPTVIGEDPEDLGNRMLVPYLTSVRHLASEFGAALVPMNLAFHRLKCANPADTWTTDGVHPNSAGHMLMAETFFEVFGGVDEALST